MNWEYEEPLAEVTCSSYDCGRDLHCFRRQRPKNQPYRSEECVACGAQLIDWDRLDQHDLNDVENTFESLELELIRYHYWHKAIDSKALKHAKGKGTVGLRQAAEHRLRKYVGKPSSELFRDGMQTPWEGNVIFYAQHATASCCRKCVEIWHGIAREKPLADDEIKYMTELVMMFVHKRLPKLLPIGPKTRGKQTIGTSLG